MTHETVLQVKDLTVEYQSEEGPVRAVDRVSFSIRRGEVLGLAGESGCGKSTVAHAIIRVLARGAEVSGEVMFGDTNVLDMTAEQLRQFRWDKVSLVMQGAMNSLNPVMTIEAQIVDAIRAHRREPKRAARTMVPDLLGMVGIEARFARSYPHELSGGMRQRCVIAMALALSPDLVLMDEPTTALDVVVQRSIMDRVGELCDELGFSVLLISHDLDLVAERASRICVMYAGKIVESGPAAKVVGDPEHPYTQALLAASMSVDRSSGRVEQLAGQPPVLHGPSVGCSFFDRCPKAFAACSQSVPIVSELSPEHTVACHLYDERRQT